MAVINLKVDVTNPEAITYATEELDYTILGGQGRTAVCGASVMAACSMAVVAGATAHPFVVPPHSCAFAAKNARAGEQACRNRSAVG